MTVRLTEAGSIELSGQCTVEEAEILLRHLIDGPGRGIEWSACEHLHCAVLQVLLAARAPMVGRPADGFLREHIAPLLPRDGAK